MKESLRNFRYGAGTLARGLGLVFRSKSRLTLSLLPILIELTLFIVGLVWWFQQGPAWLQALFASWFAIEGFLGTMIYWFGLVLFFFSFFFLLVFIVYVTASVIAAPFYGWIAESVLREKNHPLPSDLKLLSMITFTLKMWRISLAKAVVFLFIALILFVLSFVPIINILASFATFLILALDAADYSLELKGFGLRQRIRFFIRNFSFFSGFALTLLIVSLVPGLIFFLLPSAVAGSAELVDLLESPVKNAPMEAGRER